MGNLESRRKAVASLIVAEKKSEFGQFMTPSDIAAFMARMFQETTGKDICLLDAGAGIGSLTAAFVEQAAKGIPRSLRCVAWEIDPVMREHLSETLIECEDACERFSAEVWGEDFILAACKSIWSGTTPKFTHAILNPPYRKIKSDSQHRKALRSVGIETSNLYAAFVALALLMLEDGGELVAITPRSFCSGTYFKPFRRRLLEQAAIRQVHVFGARNRLFKGDNVLQENIIFHLVKKSAQEDVILSTSSDASFSDLRDRRVPFNEILLDDDKDQIIHLPTEEHLADQDEMVARYTHSLEDIGISVSTGPVVDFRLKSHLRQAVEMNCVPLVYCLHFADGYIAHPKPNRKANAIVVNEDTSKWLMPTGHYVCVRRLSSKEEKRRITPALFDPARVNCEQVGFDNHMNVFHERKKGLPEHLAKGLAVYLASSFADRCFRRFNGHTQVNAGDLRALRYPDRKSLESWGKQIGDKFMNQEGIDRLVEGDRWMAQKIIEAIEILKLMGLPNAQQNERSALSLLALAQVREADSWQSAKDPLLGIRDILDFCRNDYQKPYAENSRESFRKETMHQFVSAGVAVQNPDDPNRAPNSPKWCYQISAEAKALLATYGTLNWEYTLKAWLAGVKTLGERYKKAREMNMVPCKLPDDSILPLSPGDHSELIRDIIEQFAPRFAPGSYVVYVGDTGNKGVIFHETYLAKLGVRLHERGKMPDVILHFVDKNWLLLIESVTSVGPMDGKRHAELSHLFAESSAGLVYVTAFPNKVMMKRFLTSIAWETEVWVASDADHLIHFNGDRFLGPHEKRNPST